MALLINQGKQDTTQDNKFNPITEKNVIAQITELKLAQSQTNTLEVTMRLLNGNNKGRFIFDRVNYDPTSDFSWKYRSLRKAAGVPYSDTEPAQIDIEKLLLNKAITVDLGVRKGKNKDGEDTDYQSVTYKVVKNQNTTQPTVVATNEPTTLEVVEDTQEEKDPIFDESLTNDTEWD